MYQIILTLATGFLITFFAIPSIIKLARRKHLVDRPDERKSHLVSTPSLGGIGIFAGTLGAVILWTPFRYFGDLQYVLGAFIIIFLIGAKDDIDPIAPWKKLVGQGLAALLLILLADIRITGLYGILGIADLSYEISLIFTLLLMLLIINAYNLIDGINGLAGSLGVITAVSFGSWFYAVGRVEMASIAFALAGALVAFLYYNITPARIFMGDTGSLVIGLAASILAVTFIEEHRVLADGQYAFSAPPAMAAGILIIPVFDTLRLFISRIIKARSPFAADKKHVHHLLLNTGLTHMQATLTLVLSNLVFIAMAVLFQFLGTLPLLILLLVIASLLTALLYFINSLHTSQNLETT